MPKPTGSLTLDLIYSKVQERCPEAREDFVYFAIGQASDNILKNPKLPGDWYAEQIWLEAIRILQEGAKAGKLVATSGSVE